MRSFVFGLGLAAFALVALLATVILLFLAARSQMHFQASPTDIKYGPAQRIPPSNTNDASSRSSGDDANAEVVQPGSFGAGIVPGIPGITSGPLFPAAPQAPAYTPAPAAPSRNESPSANSASAPHNPPETGRPAASPAEPAVQPPASPGRERNSRETGRSRRIGGKSFARDATGVLVDSTYNPKAGLEEVTLVAGSDPYVRFLETRPDLRQFFRLDDHLIVVVDNIVYRVVPKD